MPPSRMQRERTMPPSYNQEGVFHPGGPAPTQYANICHKGGLGASNWNQFRQTQGMAPNSGRRPVPLAQVTGANQDAQARRRVVAQGRATRSIKLTKLIAMDCEMVGAGENGCISMLARVSLVNNNGDCVYDKYVKPVYKVTDYRTFVSGIRPHHLLGGEDFEAVRQEVAGILRNRILVGHALKHDLQALCLRHPFKDTRDTITFNKFRRENKNTMSLKNLSKQFLDVDIQDGEHDSVEDAKAAMRLYMTYRKEWERERQEAFQLANRQRKIT